MPRPMDQAEKWMNTEPCRFEKLVKPGYATLNQFAAAVFANPMAACTLAAGYLLERAHNHGPFTRVRLLILDREDRSAPVASADRFRSHPIKRLASWNRARQTTSDIQGRERGGRPRLALRSSPSLFHSDSNQKPHQERQSTYDQTIQSSDRGGGGSRPLNRVHGCACLRRERAGASGGHHATHPGC